jgi:ABC-type transport system involved in multi-copper enzyme maturation permease subunit
VLAFLSFYVGAGNYKISQAQYEAAKAQNLRQYEGLTDWFSVQSTRIFLPPQPAAVLVSGVSNDIGRTIEVQGRGDLAAEDSKYSDEPLFAAFRFLDLEFLFQMVLALFAILLGYDAISGEKERGTLRLTFANAVPRATFIAGKLIGSAAAMIVPLVTALTAASLLLPILGVPMAGSDWARLGLVVLVGILYLTAILALSVLASALTHRSSTSFLILLVIWVGSVMIIPRTAVLIAGRAVDVPTLDDINSQKSKYAAQLFAEDAEKMNSFQPKTAPRDMEALMKEVNEFMTGLADERDSRRREFGGRLDEQRRNRQQVQEALAFGMARVSPATSLSLALASISGTSLALKNQYHQGALTYQQAFADFQTEKLGGPIGGRMIRMGNAPDDEEKPKPIDLSEIPVFDYTPESLPRSLGGALVDIGILLGFNLLLFGGSFAAFLRYDLR